MRTIPITPIPTAVTTLGAKLQALAKSLPEDEREALARLVHEGPDVLDRVALASAAEAAEPLLSEAECRVLAGLRASLGVA